VVEINPHVIALRDDFQVPPDDARFSVLHGDGASSCATARHRSRRAAGRRLRQRRPAGAAESQRFYDDCHDALQPGGIMVVNLHFGHRHYDVLVDRIRRSFDGAILVVDDGDLSNSIVFACKGHSLERHRAGLVRRPKGLEEPAAQQLLAGFALIASALKEQGR
jgi:spermidine synthase